MSQEKSTLQDVDEVLSEDVTEQDHKDEIPQSKLNRFAWFIYGTLSVIFLEVLDCWLVGFW